MASTVKYLNKVWVSAQIYLKNKSVLQVKKAAIVLQKEKNNALLFGAEWWFTD